MTFQELGLNAEVLQSIEQLGFSTPTPIQEQAIPYLLGVHSDFIGLAQTGTGKTAAFGLPLIHNVDASSQLPQGLVIAPTRELCLQITRDLQAFSKQAKHKVVSVYGGADIRKQMQDIKRGCNIVVATPGRLVDLIKRKAVRLEQVDYVVLDEADEMLNMGFKEDIDMILDQTPPTKNVWLFSATMPPEVARISKNYQDNPLEVSIGHKNQSNENIEHIYHVVKEKDRYPAVKRILDVHPDIYGLIFCRTKRETGMVAEKLGKEGYSAEALHGDLSQAQRDRVMDRFRTKAIQVLVATDVAARGIDVDNITHVINYNLPDEIENYTHRSGRTARAGRKGQSIVLINTREGRKISSIEKQMRVTFTKGEVPGPADICRMQMKHMLKQVLETPIRTKDIADFLPEMYEAFADLSKEEVIQKFISTEFNRFFDYYQNAGDLNASGGKDRGRGEDFGKKSKRSSFDDSNKQRFFVNQGRRDGMNPGGLLRVICDASGMKSDQIGRIEILPSFSFFEADKDTADKIIQTVNGALYEGREVKVEKTDAKQKSRSGGGGRSSSHRGGGGGRSNRSGRSNRDFSNEQPRYKSSRGGGSRSGQKKSNRYQKRNK